MNANSVRPAFEQPESAAREVCRLASRVLDGTETNDELLRLEALLAQNAELRQLYYRMISLHSQLAWSLVEAGSTAVPPGVPGHRTRGTVVRPVSAPPPRDLPPSPVLKFLGAAIDLSANWLTSPKVLALAVAASLATYFAVLMVSLALTPGPSGGLVSHETVRPSDPKAAVGNRRMPGLSGDIGSLTTDKRAQWSSSAPAPTDSAIQLGRRYELASGRAQVVLARGTQLAIDGPAVWRVASVERLELESGKLVARVPPPAVGFTVSTPTAEVVDLGTEFGVAVDKGGSTDLHVFKGRVELKPSLAKDSPAAKPATAIKLGAGQSRHVTLAGSVSVVPSAEGAAKFQRTAIAGEQPTAALDLVDLLAGGNGRGHRRDVSIDPRNGRYGDLGMLIEAEGDGKYHAAVEHLTLDGCFIPNGSSQIDSAGHRFDFPQTGNNFCYHFWAGQQISWLNEPQQLGATDYTTTGHVFLFLNSNKGLTLDLEAIRRLNGGRSIESLRAVTGNSIPPDHLARARPGLPPPKADLFVIVDGHLRYGREGLSPDDGPFPLNISIADDDRMLTIATTDGGDSFWGDWVILGDPQLVLRSVQ